MKVDNKMKTDKKNKLRVGKFLVHALESIVDIVALCLFMFMLFFGIYSVWDTNQVQTAASGNAYQIYKPTVDDTRTFEDFKTLNSDVFGWLNIYGTNIDYPLLQSDNNEKYLNTSADGNYSLSGSIFLDYRNNKDMSDFNNVIHGHHMAGDVMFGEIGNFKDVSYFDQHQYGEIYYGTKYYGLEFFAFLEVDAYDNTIFRAPIYDSQEKADYLQLIKERAINYRDVDVTAEDRIVLLATCTTSITNGRHILVGVIRDNPENDPFIDQNSTGIKTEQKFNTSIQTWQLLLLVVLILIILILILIITVIIHKRKGREGTKINERK